VNCSTESKISQTWFVQLCSSLHECCNDVVLNCCSADGNSLVSMLLCVMQSLSAMAPSMATALRDGAATQVNAAEIVRGDIVMMHAGDKVCVHYSCLYAYCNYYSTRCVHATVRSALCSNASSTTLRWHQAQRQDCPVLIAQQLEILHAVLQCVRPG
jgi:hypothetical protein